MKLRLNLFIAFTLTLLLMGSMGCDGSPASIIFSGSHVTFSDTSPQNVITGNNFSITVTPDAGFALITTVPSDCPSGSWEENAYTTGIVTEDCTLLFFATANPVIVTPSGTNVTIDPNTPQVIDINTTESFTVSADTGYTLTNTVAGTCPAGSWDGSTYTTESVTEDCTVIFSADQNTPSTTTISASVSSLALSVNDTGTNAALTGTPRIITITNDSATVAATELSISYPSWPTGTTASSTCSSTLIADGTCTITITPGNNSTSSCNTGIAPTPGTITLSANNATSISSDVVALTYGCIYQGGFIFSVDDTTANTGSIGGKVTSLTDQAAQGAIIWSSNGNGSTGSDVDYTAILGIDETSTTSTPSPTSPAYPGGTPAYTACNGNLDGSCNTENIVSYYNFNRTSGGTAPTPLTYYAGGLCKATISGYGDWYLPSICEMGYDGTTQGSSCGTPASPTLQNMQSNLVNNANIGSLAPVIGDNYYWSSTEYSGDPTSYAWYQLFNVDQSSVQVHAYDKNGQTGVRCVRALTP